MNLRTLPLLFVACGPVATETIDTSSSSDSTSGDTSSTSTDATTAKPVLLDLGDQPADLPTERPVDTDRDLRVFVTSSHHRGDMRVDFMSIEATTPDEVCNSLGRAVGDNLIFRAWVSMDDDSPAVSFTRTSGNYIRTDGETVAPQPLRTDERPDKDVSIRKGPDQVEADKARGR